jgi:nucleoid-associated protein YgaU
VAEPGEFVPVGGGVGAHRRLGSSKRRRLTAADRRRRLGFALSVFTILVLIALPWGSPKHSVSATRPAASHPVSVASSTSYLVRSGDTVWSIANKVDPSETALMVERIEAEIGGDAVWPGERIEIPSH